VAQVRSLSTRARTVEDKEQRKRLILDAGKQLFFTRGYRETTIEKITERAGVSTRTFYLYFKSKQEIYMTLYADGIDLFRGMAEEAVSWPGMSALARLSAIAHAYYRFYKNHTEYFEILAFIHMHQAELKVRNDMSSLLDEKAIELLKIIETVIREGTDSGELTPMDPWKATNVLWGLMDGLVTLAARENVMVMGVTLEDLIKQSLEMVFYGMDARGRVRGDDLDEEVMQ